MPPDGRLRPQGEGANKTLNFGSPPQASTEPETPPPGVIEPGGGSRLGARLGASGNVYEAQSPRFEGRLALKIYRRATGVDQRVVDAFARDAVRASGLRHPHIVQILDAGALRDGTPFAAMEVLVGHTLEERLSGIGALSPAELLPLVKGVASALSAAHAAGVVHRELRPDNIFLAEIAGYQTGFVKVLDFGAGHLTSALPATAGAANRRITRYRAPEQLSGRLVHVDARADQYALAAITYRLLSGADPAVSDPSVAGGPGSALDGATATTRLSRLAPAVDAVLSKALSKAPRDRFESVALFGRAIEEAFAGAMIATTDGPARVSAAAAPAPRENPPPQTAGERRGPASGRGATTTADRLSVTQQFFDEGDHHEATNFKHHPAEGPGPTDSSLDWESFDRIPRRRTPLVWALLLLGAGAGGLAWYAGLTPPDSWRQSTVWRALHLPGPSSPVAETAAPAPPTTTPTPTPTVVAPAVSPTGAVPGPATAGVAPIAAAVPPAATPGTESADLGPASATLDKSRSADPTAAPPPAAAAASALGQAQAQAQAQAAEGAAAAAAPARAQAAEGAAAAPEGAAAAPPVATSPPPPPAGVAVAEEPPPGAAMPPVKATEKRARAASRRPDTSRRAPALRGYLWSPQKQAMVPANDATATDPWRPPPSESPPPPPQQMPASPQTDPALRPPPFNP